MLCTSILKAMTWFWGCTQEQAIPSQYFTLCISQLSFMQGSRLLPCALVTTSLHIWHCSLGLGEGKRGLSCLAVPPAL